MSATSEQVKHCGIFSIENMFRYMKFSERFQLFFYLLTLMFEFYIGLGVNVMHT